MDDEQRAREILKILKGCKNKLHKIEILTHVTKMVSTRVLVSQTKGTRISY